MIHNQTLSGFSLVQLYQGRRLARQIDAALIILLSLLILYAPLPFGSVQYSSLAAIQVVALACFFLWLVKLLYASNRDRISAFRALYLDDKELFRQLAFFHRHFWLARVFRMLTFGKWPRKNRAVNLVADETIPTPARELAYFSLFGYPVKNTGVEILALIFLAVLLLQLVPLPAFVVAVLSPAAYTLYSSAARMAETSLYFIPLSLDPHATLAKLLEYTAYFMLFLVVVNNIRTRALYWMMLYAIFAAGVFQGIYGLYEFLSGNQHIFGYEKIYGLDSASGTFINRNHFAAYLEMSIPLLIALLVGRSQSLRPGQRNIFVRLARMLETKGSQMLLLLMMIVLVGVALIFSLSRSGISFGIVSLLTFFFLYWRTREKLTRRAYLILGIGATAALAVWIGLEPILVRFMRISEEWTVEGSRWQVWKDTFRMFLHFPLFGTGAGTFREIFPMFRSFVYDSVYEQAHNDYVQFLAETGIAVILLLLAFFDLMLRRLSTVIGAGFSRLTVIQAAAFCSLVSLGLHSFTDFGFQIPAVALQGSLIAGLFFSHYHREPGRERNE